MTDSPSTASGRRAIARHALRYKGDPRLGSRNKISSYVIMSIFDDQEAYKADLLNRLRVTHRPD
jgi:hypothetical protein